MSESNSEPKKSNKIGIVTNVLAKALKLWLKTQVSHVTDLQLEILASDRQLLSGCVPCVYIYASNAVYQGIHLTKVKLVAKNIRVNMGLILKGQPLRLLEVVPVSGEVILEESDLNASLNSTLLSNALDELFVQFLPEYKEKSKLIAWQKITLDNQKFVLSGTSNMGENTTPIALSAGLTLSGGSLLKIAPIVVITSTESLLDSNKGNEFNLGTDVDIEELVAIPGQIKCHGRINVNP